MWHVGAQPRLTSTWGDCARFAVRFTSDLGVASSGWKRALDGADLDDVYDRGGGKTDTHVPSLAEYEEWLRKQDQGVPRSVVVPAVAERVSHGQVVQVSCVTPPWDVGGAGTAAQRWESLAQFVRRGGA